jgi:hypothetical protein
MFDIVNKRPICRNQRSVTAYSPQIIQFSENNQLQFNSSLTTNDTIPLNFHYHRISVENKCIL